MSARTEKRNGFSCPECRQPGVLAVVRRLVLPGDRRSDEIALEVLACACGFKTFAVTEQLQTPPLPGAARKAGSDERMGFRLPGTAVDLLAFLIARCPDPAEEYCTCPSHAALNRRDLRDRWNVLHSFAPVAGFALAPGQAPAPRAAPDYGYETLAWTKRSGGYAATVEGREWRLDCAAAPAAPHYALSIGGAIELELDVWPPFWTAPEGG